jgi:hypothetical protein
MIFGIIHNQTDAFQSRQREHKYYVCLYPVQAHQLTSAQIRSCMLASAHIIGSRRSGTGHRYFVLQVPGLLRMSVYYICNRDAASALRRY